MENQVFDKDGNEIPIQAFHPGEFLLEEINERGLKKKDVASSIKILPHHLSEIFAGKRGISARLAVRLEKLLDIDAAYWLNLQSHYDLQQARELETA